MAMEFGISKCNKFICTNRTINFQQVSLLRYSAGALKLALTELKVVDWKTRKILTMNRTVPFTE